MTDNKRIKRQIIIKSKKYLPSIKANNHNVTKSKGESQNK